MLGRSLVWLPIYNSTIYGNNFSGIIDDEYSEWVEVEIVRTILNALFMYNYKVEYNDFKWIIATCECNPTLDGMSDIFEV